MYSKIRSFSCCQSIILNTLYLFILHIYINKLHLKYKKCMYIVITKIGLLAVLVCVLDIILVPYFIFKYDAVNLTIKIIFRDVS